MSELLRLRRPAIRWHGPYHATEYGFPICDEHALFERLMLEVNQAGLSWLTVLKKREAFRAAFDGFDPERVAALRRRPTASGCWRIPGSSATG